MNVDLIMFMNIKEVLKNIIKKEASLTMKKMMKKAIN